MALIDRTEQQGECQVWTGSRNQKGYGQVRIKGRLWLAHRATWVEAHGAIPAGMLVLHRCDVPACIRLDHLWLGTNQDNLRDMAAKGRHALQQRQRCPAGHLYDEPNTYVWRGRRHCRACRAVIDKRRVRHRASSEA